MITLPYSGFRKKAPKRKFKEVVVFVHQLGGSPVTLSRHLQMANDMGFDAVAFQLKFNKVSFLQWPPFSKNYDWGVRKVWAEQITDVLDQIPEAKVLFTLSSTSSAALLAMSYRQVKDVKGWICDGGPFAQVWKCFWNYFTHLQPISNPLLRAARAGLALQLFGGYSAYNNESHAALKSLPANFPILSIRAWEDKLVPMICIEEFFSGHEQLALEVLSLPEVGHLQGLSGASKEYRPRVEKFLSLIATPTESPTVEAPAR